MLISSISSFSKHPSNVDNTLPYARIISRLLESMLDEYLLQEEVQEHNILYLTD